MEYFNCIQESTSYVRKVTRDFRPEIGIVLGSGLGDLVNELKIVHKVYYDDIPNFPTPTVEGHHGCLLFAELASGKRVVAMQGRFHFYEGYVMKEVVFPIYVMKYLGVRTLFVSNAAGGMNPAFKVGDIMLIRDHINLMAHTPLLGYNDERLGPRFPSMHEPYTLSLLKLAQEVAARQGVNVHTGVYAGVTGPSFETPAEYRYMRMIGADAVGMSTVPEIIAAKHAGMDTMGLSVISDLGGGETAVEVSHEEVLAAVEKTVPVLVGLVKEILESL